MGVFIDTHTRPARTTPRVRRVVTREKMQRKKIENAIANLPPSRGGACMNETNEGFGFDDGFGFGFLSPMTKDAAAERARRRR